MTMEEFSRVVSADDCHHYNYVVADFGFFCTECNSTRQQYIEVMTLMLKASRPGSTCL